MTTTYRVACLLFGVVSSFPLSAQPGQQAPDAPAPVESAGEVDPSEAPIDLSPPESSQDTALWAIDLSNEEWDDGSPKAMRISVAHEVSYRIGDARGMVNNRSSFRLEYSKFFLDSFFVEVDSKLNAFWSSDHRAEAEDERIAFETITPEAYLQYSKAGSDISVKVGVQKMIWGVSEGGAITDEVSPRNFSELFFIPLEESRLGQFMVNVDHFSSIGHWSFFFVPDPKFNKYPEQGTAYYFDPFAGAAEVRDDPAGGDDQEYGMRWKRTFGSTDVSVMAASLIDNDPVYRMDGLTQAGVPLISRVEQRFTLTGMTLNHARGDFLFRGEVGFKSPKAFNDAAFRTIEKNVVDSSLGMTYSLGQSNSIGIEWVNRHVLDWSGRIAGVPRNTSSLVLNTNFFFLNDTLLVNWLTIYSRPFTSVQSSVRTSYEWDDNLTFSLDAHLIDVQDSSSALHRYRNQDQVVFKVRYQF